jgi:hypothetical protein
MIKFVFIKKPKHVAAIIFYLLIIFHIIKFGFIKKPKHVAAINF